MNPYIGWALAAIGLVAGWRSYGYSGLALGATLIAFWLVLQFNRSVRILRNAGGAPVGHVDSAVMLNAKLRAGMQMMAVLTLTKSLGRRVDAAGGVAAPAGRATEVFAWSDGGGAEVIATFRNGRCASWALRRPPETAE
jgi:hypothetical protein